MHRRNLAVLAALLGLAFAQPSAFAQWKWRDKNGLTQYSDLPPPPGVADQDILARPSASSRRAAPVGADPGASAAPLLAVRASEPDLEAKRRKAEQDAAADKKKADDAKNAAVKADNCNRARSEMRALDSGQRMARINDKGEREYLDDDARAEETRHTRDAVASMCN